MASRQPAPSHGGRRRRQGHRRRWRHAFGAMLGLFGPEGQGRREHRALLSGPGSTQMVQAEPQLAITWTSKRARAGKEKKSEIVRKIEQRQRISMNFRAFRWFSAPIGPVPGSYLHGNAPAEPRCDHSPPRNAQRPAQTTPKPRNPLCRCPEGLQKITKATWNRRNGWKNQCFSQVFSPQTIRNEGNQLEQLEKSSFEGP